MKERQQVENPHFKETKFISHTKELNDTIYDLSYNILDLYIVITRKIVEHARRMYNNGAAVENSIEELIALVIVIPPDTTAPNVLELRIWEHEVDRYIKQKIIIASNIKNLIFWSRGRSPRRIAQSLWHIACFTKSTWTLNH